MPGRSDLNSADAAGIEAPIPIRRFAPKTRGHCRTFTRQIRG